jgi:hypothetical protein
MPLVGHWKCQDNAPSTNVVGEVGGDGTLTNAGNTSASSVAGPGGQLPLALNFDGVNDFVLTPYTGNLGNNFSVMAWVYVDGTPLQTAVGHYFVAKLNGWALNYGHTVVEYRGFHCNAGTYYGANGVTIPTQQWVLVAGTYDSSAFRAYVISTAGEVLSSNFKSQVATMASGAGAVRFGTWDGAGTGTFDGKLCGVRLYNETLNQSQIQAIAAEVFPASESRRGQDKLSISLAIGL